MFEEEQFSPFMDVGTEQYTTLEAPYVPPLRFPNLNITPTINTGVKVVNKTTERIAYYDTIGLPMVLCNECHRQDGVSVVEVEYYITSTRGTTPLPSVIDQLSTRLPPELIERLKDQVAAFDGESRSSTTTLVLRWSIPLSVIRESINGVRIRALGIVLRHLPFDQVMWRTSEWPKVDAHKRVSNTPQDGLHAYLNTPDIRVSGVWINLGKGAPLMLCAATHDPDIPYGLVIWSNGKEEKIDLTLMSQRGYYTTRGQAVLAHARSSAEEKELQKEQDARAKLLGLTLLPGSTIGDKEMKLEKVEQERIKTKDAGRKSVKDMAMAILEFVKGLAMLATLVKQTSSGLK